MPVKSTGVSDSYGAQLTERRKDNKRDLDAAHTKRVKTDHQETHRETDESDGDRITILAVLDGDGGLGKVDWVTTGSDHALNVAWATLLKVGSRASCTKVDGSLGLTVVLGGGSVGRHCRCVESRMELLGESSSCPKVLDQRETMKGQEHATQFLYVRIALPSCL